MLTSSLPNKSLLLGILAIALACWYTWYIKQTYEATIIDHWENKIIRPKHRFAKVAIGLNANVDLIVRGSELLTALNVDPGAAENHSTLQTLRDLQEIFAHSLSQGYGVERSFSNSEIFQYIIQTAEKMEKTEWSVGGNAALMAQKIASIYPDTKVILVGPVGPRLKNLLNFSIKVPTSSIISQDEVHLIMEYQHSEKWGDYSAPCANRFITSHDVANSQMAQLQDFFISIEESKPDLVVLSGLHMFDGQAKEDWSPRVDELVKHLNKVPTSIPVHLELASIANPQLVQTIIEKVLPSVTSLGLNEQEIEFLSNVGKGPHKSIFNSTGQLVISHVSDTIHWLLRLHKQTRLSRVHYHSLTFHVMAVNPTRWSNIPSALAAGTRMAGLQACDIRDLDPAKVKLKIPETFSLHGDGELRNFDVKNPVLSWQREHWEFAFSPVLVCNKPLKTVGLGDAISATGLLYSEFS